MFQKQPIFTIEIRFEIKSAEKWSLRLEKLTMRRFQKHAHLICNQPVASSSLVTSFLVDCGLNTPALRSRIES